MFEKFHRGDIYSADLSPGIGSEQSGSRPVLILQNNVGNCFSPTIIIAAITSVSKKSRKFPTHYHLSSTVKWSSQIMMRSSQRFTRASSKVSRCAGCCLI